jgi:hypothetical protein
MSFWNTLVAALRDRKTAASGAAKTESAADGRAALRKRQRMKDGFIWCEGLIAPRACTIRDMSALGAQISLWNDDIKPSLLRGTLKLYSCADQKEVDCTVARREGTALGLRFLSGLRAPTRKYT